MDTSARIELIRDLCSIEGRGPGTDAERRAANTLGGRLKDLGRRVEIEPTFVHPQYSLVLALHVTLAVAGSLAGVAAPAVGFALVLLSAASLYWDVQTRHYLLRRVFFRRASQNILSRGPKPDAPGRVILCAHYDVARTGFVFRSNVKRGTPSIRDRVARLASPAQILFWTIASLLPILGARMAGLEASWLSIVQLVPTTLLILSLFPLVDIALSDLVPGANDNASGVATAISIAAELDATPPESLDVWVLLTGGEETLSEGMRNFVRRHRDSLDPSTTFFLNIDTVGSGEVRYEDKVGPIFAYATDARLVELCEAVATADREGAATYGARPSRSTITDAFPPLLAGFPALSIGCLDERDTAPGTHTMDDVPDRIDSASLDRAHGFLLDLIGALDRDAGRRFASGTAAEPRDAAAAERV